MIEFQRKILGDATRNAALYAALRKMIRPGCTMSDIGSGTGYLSFLARTLGAERCYLYETSGDLLNLSKRIAKRNGIMNCEFIHAHSHAVRKPVKTDVVISETLGNFALEEHIIENMEDAKRFLKSGGILIPFSLTQWIAPVTSDRLQREIDIFENIKGDIVFEDARNIALQNMYVKTVLKNDLLKDGAKVWDRMDFHKHVSSKRKGKVTWEPPADTIVYGFCLFYEAELAPGITLSTSPYEKPTHWEQIYLPLFSPLKSEMNDVLSCVLTSDTRHSVGLIVTWEAAMVNQKGKSGGRQKLSTAKGYIA